MHIEKAAGALGAYVDGVSLAEAALSSGLFGEIRSALLEHEVLFFRNQDISPLEYQAFAACFPPIERHPAYGTVAEAPDVQILESTEEAPSKIEVWHTDMTFLEKPPSASVLRGIDVPSYGGDTMFASMAAAHDTLSETFQKLLSGLEAIHDTSRTFSRGSYPTPGKASADKPPGTVHPVVRTHPETGRKVLFVNPAFTRIIQGMHRRESDGLLGYLYDHQALPEFSCRFRWQKNSVAFWDNRAVQHRAVADNLEARRRMERVTVEGDRPV